MPVILSKRLHSACVATTIADKDYFSTEKTLLTRLQNAPHCGRLAALAGTNSVCPGKGNDLTTLWAESAYLPSGCLVGDKAYASAPPSEQLETDQHLTPRTPAKLKKSPKYLYAAHKGYSTHVSRMRQPIESLFNWFIKKPYRRPDQIQNGAKIRLEKGAVLHCLGRFAAGLHIIFFNS